MSQSLEQLADAEPDRPAVIGAQRTLTRAEWHARADALADGLEGEHGVAEGDRVALALPNGLALLEAMLALAKLGATPVGLPRELPAEDVGAVLAAADAELLLTADAQLAAAHRGVHALDDLIAAHDGAQRRFTGGRPAAPMITVDGTQAFVRRLDAERPQVVAAALADLLARVELRGGERHLLAVHHAHWAPMLFANLALVAGGAVVIADEPSAAEALDLVTRHEVTSAVLHADRLPAGAPPSLRTVVCVGEPPADTEAGGTRQLVLRGGPACGPVSLDPPGERPRALAGIELLDGERVATPLAAGGPRPL